MKVKRDMKIDAQKGQKIQLNRIDVGFPADRELVKKHLVMGEIYTVEKTIPMEYATAVFIQEVADVPFNSVFFCEVVN